MSIDDSRLISFIRFPMTIGIVLIHCHYVLPSEFVQEHNLAMYDIMFTLFYDSITRIFVPLFFLISGFLFFKSGLSFDKYLTNLRKRIKSLLIPYFLYIIIALAIFMVIQQVAPGLVSNGKTPILSYSYSEWLGAFGIGGQPFVGPFWFIRNLFLLGLLSPILYLIIKYASFWSLFAIGLLWVLNIDCWFTYPTVSDTFFFSIGAYISIHNKEICRTVVKLYPISLLYIPLMIICIYTGKGQEDSLFKINIVMGIILFTYICLQMVKNGHTIPNKIASASFMIFAMHEPYLDQFYKVAFKILPKASNTWILNIELITSVILIGLLTVIGIVTLHILLTKYAPRLIKILDGSR